MQANVDSSLQLQASSEKSAGSWNSFLFLSFFFDACCFCVCVPNSLLHLDLSHVFDITFIYLFLCVFLYLRMRISILLDMEESENLAIIWVSRFISLPLRRPSTQLLPAWTLSLPIVYLTSNKQNIYYHCQYWSYISGISSTQILISHL